MKMIRDFWPFVALIVMMTPLVLAHPSGHKFGGGAGGGAGTNSASGGSSSSNSSSDSDNTTIAIPSPPHNGTHLENQMICQRDANSVFCENAIERDRIAYFCRRIPLNKIPFPKTSFRLPSLGIPDIPALGWYACR